MNNIVHCTCKISSFLHQLRRQMPHQFLQYPVRRYYCYHSLHTNKVQYKVGCALCKNIFHSYTHFFCICTICTSGDNRGQTESYAHFSETFVRDMSGLYLETRRPNLKFVSLAVLELLAFNTQKFTGSRDHDHAHFSETFVSGHLGTVPGNTPAKFEVRIFSRFGAISI